MVKHTMRRTQVKRSEQLRTQPGKQHEMRARPRSQKPDYTGSGKLKDKVAIITGGDSGIGRAVAIAFAQEGADVAIVYLNEDKDAADTKKLVEEQGAKAIAVSGDIGDEKFCETLVKKIIDDFGRVDILINNAGEQHPQEDPLKVSPEQLEKTFRTNVFGMFYLTQAALPRLKKGSAIVNTASVTAYKGHPTLLDYSATKGAIVAFTRSLSQMLAPDIRVNAIAPGPIWTPLIPSTFPADQVKKFGQDTPLGRPGQPEELAPAYVYLASDDSSFVTGQTLHVNGGTIVNS